MQRFKLLFLLILGGTHGVWAFQSPKITQTETQVQRLNQSAAKFIANNQLSEAENEATEALSIAQSEKSM